MSSLHQDRLLVEGSEPVTGTASTLPSARGTRRRTVGTPEEKATGTVPTQRQGTAKQSGTTTTTRTRTRPEAAETAAPRTKRTGTKAAATGTRASRARAATVKAASVKAATAKAATAKVATAARAAAVTTVANHTASVRVARATRAAASAEKPAAAKSPATKSVSTAKAALAKPAPAEAAAKPASGKATEATTTTAKAKAAPAKAATAKAPAAKATPAKATPAKATPAEAVAPAVKAPRPTPYKRPVADAAVPAPEPITVAELLGDEAPEAVVVRKDTAPALRPAGAATLAARLPRFLRRRPPTVHRRPALYLAAALIGSLAVGGVTTTGPEAQATASMSHSVSVADRLGIDAADPAVALAQADATKRLGELVASRNVRDAEQAAAAQAQAAADQAAAEAAAEAARPKAVMPIQGARLTSPFGARWGTLHAGVDLAAPMLTPEFAAMDGVVLQAGPASGYGNVVYIQHENGDVTVYGHMEEVLVSAGQVVKAGDTVALVGSRGQSTGPHLHFEVRVGGMNGTKIDPLPWLRERGVAI